MNSFCRVFKGRLGLSSVLRRTLKTPTCVLFLWLSSHFSLGELAVESICVLLWKILRTSALNDVRDFHKCLLSLCFCTSSYETSNSSWLWVRPSNAEQVWKSHHLSPEVKMSVSLSSLLGNGNPRRHGHGCGQAVFLT